MHQLVSEILGTVLLSMVVVGSRIMGDNLSPEDDVALLANVGLLVRPLRC